MLSPDVFALLLEASPFSEIPSPERRPPSFPQDYIKTLSEEFAKTNQQVYTRVDKDALETCLEQALTACSSSEAGNDHKSRLTSVLEAMQLKATEGVKGCTSELANLLNEVLSIPKASGQGVLLKSMCVVNAKHHLLKSSFGISAALKKVAGAPATSAWVSAGDAMDKQTDWMESCISLMELILEVAKILAGKSQHTAKQGGDSSDCSDYLGKLIGLFGQIHSLADKLDLGQSLRSDIAKLESSSDAPTVGRGSFHTQLSEFKATAQLMAAAVTTMQADLSVGKAELQGSAKTFMDQSHKVKQLATFSDTPAQALAHLTFATSTFHGICTAAHKAVECQGCVPADYVPDSKLLLQIEKCLTGEQEKGHLVWLLGDAGGASFLEDLRTMLAGLKPACEEFVELQAKQASEAVAGVESMLAAAGASDEDFFKHFNTTKLNKLRALRAKAKGLMDNLKPLLGEGESRWPEKVKGGDAMMDAAKMQTIKWGLLSFVLHVDIEAATQGGTGLRSQLEKLWGLNSMDKTVAEYLGETLVKRIEHLVAKDKQRKKASVGKKPPATSAAAGKQGDVVGDVAEAASVPKRRRAS